MKHLRSWHYSLCVMLIAFIAACTTATTPDTFNKRVAAGYVAVQTVADSATTALKAGKLSPADATNVSTTAKSVLQALDVATTLHAANAAAGEDKLAAALAILTALQTYLATQGVK